MQEITSILIVEDELLVAHTMKAMFAEINFADALIYGNKDSALVSLRSGQIDLAVFDINLGKGREGTELSRVANELGIPHFFVTS